MGRTRAIGILASPASHIGNEIWTISIDIADHPVWTGKERRMPQGNSSSNSRLVALLSIACLVLPPSPVAARQQDRAPAFVATKALVYCRRAPAFTSPPVWVFTRRGIPLRVLSQDDIWYYVEEPQSERCWVNQSIITHAAYAIVRANTAVGGLARPSSKSKLRARLEPGVTGRIIACAGDWRKLEIAAGLAVWTPRSALWGDVDGCSAS